MALETRKFDGGLNVGWEKPLKAGPLVLYMDSVEMWGARRKLLKQTHVPCIHIHVPAEAEGLLGSLAEALDVVREHDPSELLVIASNATVVPALVTVPALCPAKLLLVNPRPCAATPDVQEVVELRRDDIAALPAIKVMCKHGEAFGEEVADCVAAVAPHLREVELSDFSQATAKLIASAAYADSFAAEYADTPAEAD